ncbi:hypothetical protein NW238_03195, partial [Mycoplasma zalophidermidis]|nr:hypothetical protein [Mycoplasma zalophidermidis]
LWKTKQGIKFFNYLKIKHNLKDEDIVALNYESAMQYYKSYINELYWSAKYNDFISINPVFNAINDDQYMSEEFRGKYITNGFEQAYRDILGDFEYKSEVNIANIEISEDKQGIYIYLNPKTSEDIYRLQQRYFLNVKFRDVDSSAKTLINLNLNQELLLSLARDSLVSEYIKKLNQNINRIFTNDMEEISKLNISLSFNVDTKILNIDVKVKEEYKDRYRIEPNNTFILQIEGFADEESINSNENNIFEGLVVDDINLSGLDDYDEIKSFILEQIAIKIPHLKLGTDYEIKNLDTVIKQRIKPQINVSNVNLPRKSSLVLEALNGRNGVFYVGVINTTNKIIDNDIDLKNIKIDDLIINENNIVGLKTKVIEYITDELNKYGLNLNYDVRIINYNEGIWYLSKGKSAKFDFIIEGINKKIRNTTTVNITNHAEFVNDENGNRILYDLSLVVKWVFKYSEMI